ncbi:MAG TPA: helix-turn-helix domain-containing protein [Desulfomonilia bacterium]|nr:helix-turn-helix domain-containing protein [Desulfomonilia bacterium]
MSEEKLTLGEYFKRERERKGIDLKEIEERTKISAQTLIFLEEDQLDMLPPRTFLRGFLRVISKEFHFDEEELLAHLEETLSSQEHKNKQAKEVSYRSKPSMPFLLIIIAVILIALVIFAVSLKKCGQEPQGDQKTSGLSQGYALTVPEVAGIFPT